MRMNEVVYDNSRPIDGYGEGFFRVGGEVVEGPIALTPDGLQSWGGYEDPETLLALAGEVDVIFVGTGAEIAHIPADLRERLEEAELGVEVMATGPACRSYNVLLSEGRRIAAALLPV